jgi:hypothetical protein
MHEDAAHNTPSRRFAMYSKFDFIPRFAKEVYQAVRLVAFDVEIDLDVTEEDIIEELEVRGYGIYAGQ